MNIATLRIEGSKSALQLARNALELEPDTTWSKGEARRRGGYFEDSGMNVMIADAANQKELSESIRAFVSECGLRGFSFTDARLSAEISIGVTVGDSEQFMASLDFSASDLLALGRIGLALNFSAYPTSAEANERG